VDAYGKKPPGHAGPLSFKMFGDSGTPTAVIADSFELIVHPMYRRVGIIQT
jgi:hypothetical protein